MREVLSSIKKEAGVPCTVPDHPGLAYETWSPVKTMDEGKDEKGKIPDGERAAWLQQIANTTTLSGYVHAFDRWKASFSAEGDEVFELATISRLLIGHGNMGPTDVGITLHHTWGIPVIPGSALKGLLAHYVDAVYGPDDLKTGSADDRAQYQGVQWKDKRIERGPGAIYRALFGAPEAAADGEMRKHGFEAGAAAGLVTFHDALYVPGTESPLCTDVLTVHQKDYYNTGQSWPNDYDAPKPVAFLTVRKGIKFLFALSGPPDWTALVKKLLSDALEDWGVGGKTSAGYGRLVQEDKLSAKVTGPGSVPMQGNGPIPKANDHVQVVLLEGRTKKGGWKARHAQSGIEGPIQNHERVPVDKKPGDVLTVVVKIAKGAQSAFEVS